MNKSRVLAIFFLLSMALLMPVKAGAQIIEVGATGGLSYYVGDINPKKHFSQSELGLGAVVRYYQNTRWAFRFQYSNMNLTSSDAVAAYRPERGYVFVNVVNDFALLAEFNFFDYWTGSNRDYLTPYIFAGVSYFMTSAKLENLNSNGQPLPIEISESVNGTNISVPFGIGVKYSLYKRIGLSLEWRMHKTFTDELDGIVDNYYSKEISDGYQYKKESFGYKCDWFGMLGLSITYRFNLPRKDACHSGIKARF